MQLELVCCSSMVQALTHGLMQSSMAAGDHYVVYSKVAGGKVLAASALSAVHHRKTGTSY